MYITYMKDVYECYLIFLIIYDKMLLMRKMEDKHARQAKDRK